MPDSSRRSDIEHGIKKGLMVAAGLAIIATVVVLAAAASGDAPKREATVVWAVSMLFYLVGGVAGGALYGFLRPIQHRYVGRLLTAYLVLFLVYGGGSIAIGPLLEPTDAPIWGVLALAAVLCLVLAPIYVEVVRRFW